MFKLLFYCNYYNIFLTFIILKMKKYNRMKYTKKKKKIFVGCNCNNHATRCHFDSEVFERTGRISGGVCDECQHSTMGRNCEQCKQGFYRDPGRNFSDPDVCQRK